MRIIESIIKFTLFVVIVFSTLFIISFQTSLIMDELLWITPWMSGGLFFIFFLISVLGFSSFPLWDVGAYIETDNVEEISRFTRKYKRGFAMFALAFFGLICFLSPQFSFTWWIGAVILFFFYVWFFFLRGDF